MRSRQSCCQKDEGFTLLETLVSIVIIAMIILAGHNFLLSVVATGKRITTMNTLTQKMMILSMQLNRDLLEAVIDDDHPLSLTFSGEHCLSHLEFFTQNRANPANIYADSLYIVRWSIVQGRLSRVGIDGDDAIIGGEEKYPEVICLRLTKFEKGEWRNMERVEYQHAAGIAWKALLTNSMTIEQVIPEGE